VNLNPFPRSMPWIEGSPWWLFRLKKIG